jgi:LmbE family N-acetylglucosaminyl deacetylase
MNITDSYDRIFSDVKNVLVILAHPDDMEINCGGLIARLIKDSKKVRLIITTNGGKGVKDRSGVNEVEFGNLRIEEQKKAGLLLGVPKEENINLNVADGEYEASLENIKQIVFHIRQFKPDLIITHNPQDCLIDFNGQSCWVNHRDHRNTALVAIDAAYPYSRDRNFFPEQLNTPELQPHTVTKILLADSYTKSTVLYFAINDFLDVKKSALMEHISAFSPESAADYIEENKIGDGYYEPLGFYEIY